MVPEEDWVRIVNVTWSSVLWLWKCGTARPKLKQFKLVQ